MLTREAVSEAVKSGERKGNILDGRDFIRLSDFFPVSERGLNIEHRSIGVEPEIAPAAPPSAVGEAIGYVLNRIQIDPNVGYYCGVGTQVFHLLCKAEAELTGRALADIETERRRNLTPAHREQRPEVEILRSRLEEARQ